MPRGDESSPRWSAPCFRNGSGALVVKWGIRGVGRARRTLAVASCVLLVATATACSDGSAGEVVPPSSGDSTLGSAATATSVETTEQPAAAGSVLASLSAPPERSLWALSDKSYDAGVELAVEFEPYGIGPSSLGPSIVARVSSATARGSSGRVPELAGRNVVFVLGESVVETGGHYAGTAVTTAKGDRVVLVLKDVKPTSGP